MILNNSSDNRCPCHVPDIKENAFMDLVINTIVAFGLREIKKNYVEKVSCYFNVCFHYSFPHQVFLVSCMGQTLENEQLELTQAVPRLNLDLVVGRH